MNDMSYVKGMLYQDSDTGPMSSETRYLATLPTIPFALNEARIIAGMMLEGKTRADIKDEIHENNLLNSKSDSSEKKVFDYTYNRLKDYPDELKSYILSDDLSDARMSNLISIMQYDNLFREFVFEVYVDSRQRRIPITDYEIMTFFERKAQENDTVASWKHVTIFKLRRLYTRILFEAGFLKTSSGAREPITPFVSRNLVEVLTDFGYQEYLEATVGRI